MNTQPPPPLYSKLFLQVLSMVLLSLATLTKGGGGSQTQHYGQAIYKIKQNKIQF